MERKNPFHSIRPFTNLRYDAFGSVIPATMSEEQSLWLMKYVIGIMANAGGAIRDKPAFISGKKTISDILYEEITAMCETEEELLYIEHVMYKCSHYVTYTYKRIRQAYMHNIISLPILEMYFMHDYNLASLTWSTLADASNYISASTKTQEADFKNDERTKGRKLKRLSTLIHAFARYKFREAEMEMKRRFNQQGQMSLANLFGIRPNGEQMYQEFMRTMV